MNKNTIRKMNFIFHIVLLFMEDCTCFDLYSAYCIRCTFLDIDVSTKRNAHRHRHHSHFAATSYIIAITILLFTSPLVFFPSSLFFLLPLPSSASSKSFPVCIYKKLARVSRMKEIELEEKKNTLLVQLFMNKKLQSKLTLQQ